MSNKFCDRTISQATKPNKPTQIFMCIHSFCIRLTPIGRVIVFINCQVNEKTQKYENIKNHVF